MQQHSRSEVGPGPGAATRLRVATLNVWALPEPLAKDVEARLAAIGSRLRELDLDLVGFQEAWTPDAREQLLRAGLEAGLPHAWEPDSRFASSGLLVLSRLPIQSARFEPFVIRPLPQHPRHIDFLGGKGFVHLRIETDAGPLSVVNTHLQACYRRDVPHGYRSHRTGQIVQLATRMREWREPVLVLGDFNCEAGDPEHQVLLGLTGLRDSGQELRDAAPTVWPGNAYRRSRNTGKRVDFVLARHGVATGLEPVAIQRAMDELLWLGDREYSYSNHAAVAAALELVPGRSGAAPGARPEAVALAAGLLDQGRRDAMLRREQNRLFAGAGLATAMLVGFGSADPLLSRRRLLRRALSGAALASLPPGLALGMFNEVYVPEEIEAFDKLARGLDRFSRTVDESIA